VILLDYLFIPMINFLVIGIYLYSQFPAVPNGRLRWRRY
jgi:putrescine importer